MRTDIKPLTAGELEKIKRRVTALAEQRPLVLGGLAKEIFTYILRLLATVRVLQADGRRLDILEKAIEEDRLVVMNISLPPVTLYRQDDTSDDNTAAIVEYTLRDAADAALSTPGAAQ